MQSSLGGAPGGLVNARSEGAKSGYWLCAIGERVKVKLATFPYQEFGMVEGIVSRVSPNAVNEQNGGLVFPVQVQLKQRSVKTPDQEVLLSPGMAETAEIVTRQKTVMSFLLDPNTTSWDRAFSVR